MDQVSTGGFGSLGEAYRWLDGHINYERRLDAVRYDGRTFSLDGFSASLERLGNPHRGRRTVHIAGTRGKGSSALLLEGLLMAAGQKVATFTSPHIHEYRERIRINGAPISGKSFCAAIAEAASARLGKGERSFKTVFEYLTAAFFLAARSESVDWMVVETGLGGRLDSTNVLEPGPVLLTMIGLEHTHLLGDTIEAIAREKAAILKPGGWGVYAPQPSRSPAGVVFGERARETGTTLVRAMEARPLTEARYHARGMELRFGRGEGSVAMQLERLGPYLVENIGSVLTLYDELEARRLAPGLSPEARGEALGRVELPGRMEAIVRDGDRIASLIADSSHCYLSGLQVSLAMGAHFKQEPAIAVVGMASDKSHEAFFQGLVQWPFWKRIICYTAPTPRAEPGPELARRARETLARQKFEPRWPIEVASSVEEALESAADCAEKRYRTVATGSIYSLARVIEWSRHNGRTAHETQGTAQTHARPGPGDSGT